MGTSEAAGVTVLRTYLEFDPNHPVTRALLVDAHKGHRITMAPFAYALESKDFFTGMSTGHANHRADHNILWAVNARHLGNGSGAREFVPRPRVRMMVQSDIEPRFEHHLCADLNDALVAAPVTRRHVPNTAEGAVIEYQVVVNPRQHVRRGGRDRIVTARGEAQIQGWWRRKATAAGLTPATDPAIDDVGFRVLSTRGSRADARIEHVRLTGKATVTDPARYAAAAHEGVGAARAYGCGLLLAR